MALGSLFLRTLNTLRNPYPYSFRRTMSTSFSRLKPPVRTGMLDLDRAAFDVRVPVLAARVPVRDLSSVRKGLMRLNMLLDLPKHAPVVPDPTSSTHKLVLLGTTDKDALGLEAVSLLAGPSGSLELGPHTVTLGYDHWSAAELLESIIPEGLGEGTPTAFTTTGHLAHMNLRDQYLPYRYIIGQIILDKNAGLRTVVNKLDTIDNEFRFFKMEVIAGETDFLVTTSESGCKFTFDFSTVYWNSRLSHEHERLCKLFQPGELVADVMGGVGPFAVPAAKKLCFVLGNDLNPSSFAWMEKNRVTNKVQATLRCSNLDGRAFIRAAPTATIETPFDPLPLPKVKQTKAVDPSSTQPASSIGRQHPATLPSPPRYVNHFVMNLPSIALEFLDAFRGSYVPLLALTPPEERDAIPMPLVHVHCFSKLEGAEAEEEICNRASVALGYKVSPADGNGFKLHEVRRVAPTKLMFCLSFRLPKEVAFFGA